MKRWLSLVLVLGFLLPLLLVPQPLLSSVQAHETIPGGPPILLLADPNVSTHRVPAPARALSPQRVQSANINITYLPPGATDRFDFSCLAWPTAAQTAFNYAAGIWETLIHSPVTIEIHACWADMPEGALGGGNADDWYRNFPGAPVADTWYPVALANALSGSDLAPTRPDMHLVYSKKFQDSNQWYFDTDGNTPATQYDFVSVVLHEIAHGLGFAGSMEFSTDGTQARWGYGTGYPISYDRFTQDGNGNALINTAIYPNPSTALANALTSNNVWFNGPHANVANGGGRVKLYAPYPWRSGSSYSHLDEIYNGTLNSLMTYSLSKGESEHNPGPVAMGILQDVGWTTGAPAAPPTVSGITPNTAANTGSVAVAIVGSNFQNGATVRLTRAGQSDIAATGVTVVNANQITGNLNLTGAATGTWNVVVANPDTQSGTLPNGFTVTAPGGKTWTGAVSADWHTSGNWNPTGVPVIGDDVVIPATTRDPIISTGDAAVNNLTINSGATVDLTDRALTVEGALINNGTLKQTRELGQSGRTEFLRITNQAGSQDKYYGVDITPQGNAYVSSHETLRPVELTLDSLPARSATPRSAAIYAPDASVSLVIDDGVHETAYGVNNTTAGTGKQFIWLNRFTPEGAAYPFILNEIWVMFDSFGGGANVNVGDAIDLVVYEDSDGDPSNGATWLATIPVTVQAVNGTVWSVYSLSSPILLEAPGDVIIAAINRYIVSGVSPVAYPATIDVTTGQDRSWLGWWSGDPPSPAVLPPDLRFDLMTGDSAGNWLIRGYGSTVTANTPPTLSGLPDQTVPMNGSADNAIDLWAYANDAEDADADLTFSIVNTPNPNAGVTLDDNRYISINPAADWTGQTDVEVQVQDTGGLTDTDTFRVTVVGTEPDIEVAPASFEETLLVDGMLTRTLTISNTGGAALIYLINDGGVTWLSQNPSNGTIPAGGTQLVDVIFDAAGLTVGDYATNLTIISNDPDESTVIVPVTMHVTDDTANTPPVIAGIPDQVVIPGSVYLPFDLWPYASDAESPNEDLTFVIDNTPNPDAGVSIESNRYLHIDPTPGWTGQTTVIVRVTDPGGLSDTDDFLVIVGQAPNIEVTPTSFHESVPQNETRVRTLTINNTGVESLIFLIDDGNTAWLSQAPASGTIAGGGTRSVSITFDATGLDAGNYYATLTIANNDPNNNPVTIPVTMSVTSTGEPSGVTVAISGNQFCANRATGVKRCFDVNPTSPMNATVRFYFSEAERNGLPLNDLLVFRYDDDWIEESGPYTRGGVGDALYVETQNVNEFSIYALDIDRPPTPDHYNIYLPLVLKRWPPIPDTPVLNAISNADGDGNYAVTWNAAYLAETYTLQEATDAAFSTSTTRYTGSGTSWNASNKPAGTYYYRVRASRSWQGQTLYSAWSNVRSVVVQPPPSGPAGLWRGQGVEFYVSPDKAYVNRFAIYVNVPQCGIQNLKIIRATPIPLSNNQFSFTGSFYGSGTLHTNTTASGNAGLNRFYIPNCGYISGSFSWTANWVNSSQPSLVYAEVVELEEITPATNDHFIVLLDE